MPRSAEERVAPVLMAATAALALLPLVWHGNIPGHGINCSMAIVIPGGPVTSTLLNLFFLLMLCARFARNFAVTNLQVYQP